MIRYKIEQVMLASQQDIIKALKTYGLEQCGKAYSNEQLLAILTQVDGSMIRAIRCLDSEAVKKLAG